MPLCPLKTRFLRLNHTPLHQESEALRHMSSILRCSPLERRSASDSVVVLVESAFSLRESLVCRYQDAPEPEVQLWRKSATHPLQVFSGRQSQGQGPKEGDLR